MDRTRPDPRRFDRPSRVGPLLIVFWVALLAAGCATGSSGRADAEPTDRAAQGPPPGSQAWQGGALRLPKGSPIVASARLKALLANARGLRRWMIDEPQMFGPDGEQFVQRFRSGWNQLAAGLGSDPLSEEAVDKMGIDLERPVYTGFYPAEAAGGRQFVRGVEEAIRAEVDTDGEESLIEILEQMDDGVRETPSGLHTRVIRSVESTRPRAGFRAVIPVTEYGEFAERIAAAAELAGYQSMSLTEEWEPTGDEEVGATASILGFYDLDSRWPALVVRDEGEWVEIDVLFREFSIRPRSTDDAEAVDRLSRALHRLVETFGTGRPAAPAPADQPAIALAADQRATAAFARMETYKNVLQQLSREDIEKRDRSFVSGIVRAMRIGDNWEVAADALTGVSYAFHGRPPAAQGDYFFRTAMTLYGPEPPEPPLLDDLDVGLGLDSRAFGVSLDLDPLFSPSWKQWLAIDQPSDVIGHSEAADSNPALYLMAMPRNLALFLVNVEKLVDESIPEALQALYDRRDSLKRLEVGTAGIDVHALRRRPKFAGLLTFDREAEADDIDVVAKSLPSLMTVLFRLSDSVDERGEEFYEKATEPLKRDELARFPIPESHPADPFHYFVHTADGRGFVFFSYGLEDEEAQQEVDRIVAGETAPTNDSAFYTRLEPVALLSALTAFEPNALDPIDPGILGQRIGPMTLSIEPQAREGVQMLRYQFELQKPPEL
jgi:hypothetical protein